MRLLQRKLEASAASAQHSRGGCYLRVRRQPITSSDRVRSPDRRAAPHAPRTGRAHAAGRGPSTRGAGGGDASDVVLPPTARSAGRIAPRRLGCLRAAAQARRARRPCAAAAWHARAVPPPPRARGTAPFGVTCPKRVPEFWVKCTAQNIFACILARAIPRQVLRVRGPRLSCV